MPPTESGDLRVPARLHSPDKAGRPPGRGAGCGPVTTVTASIVTASAQAGPVKIWHAVPMPTR
jgi:hypothetical protein